MEPATPESLIAFEKEIEELYTDGKIHSPVHFSRGNEEELIEIFKDVKKDDWVFSTHRSHYHALLKGADPEWLKNEILENRSMHINFDKFVTSSIVGGVLPIATGVAMALKRQGSPNKVWVFVGDMASLTGIFTECESYACGHELPLELIIEDNGVSVNTPTYKVWGAGVPNTRHYSYTRGLPHHGTGAWINF